jgi:hypothetical protein
MEGLGHEEAIPAEQVRAILAYTLEHRGADPGAFDVVIEGHTASDPERARAELAPYADTGLTWWVEKIGWFRGPVDAMQERVRSGPPRT